MSLAGLEQATPGFLQPLLFVALIFRYSSVFIENRFAVFDCVKTAFDDFGHRVLSLFRNNISVKFLCDNFIRKIDKNGLPSRSSFCPCHVHFCFFRF